MFNATLFERIDVTHDLCIFRVVPDAGVTSFAPGQYVALGLPGEAARHPDLPPEPEPAPPGKLIKRAYSIGSSPEETRYLEFFIAIVPSGALTSRLVCLKPGDRLYCAPKITGTFVIDDVPPERNLVLVSTGTGLAPYLSMVRTPRTWSPGRKITILNGVRFERDLGYREEIREIQKHHPLSYLPFVSREDENPGVFRKGYVQRAFFEELVTVSPNQDHVFLCGNPSMIEDVEKLLLERGFTVHGKKQPGNLHLEKYW